MVCVNTAASTSPPLQRQPIRGGWVGFGGGWKLEQELINLNYNLVCSTLRFGGRKVYIRSKIACEEKVTIIRYIQRSFVTDHFKKFLQGTFESGTETWNFQG